MLNLSCKKTYDGKVVLDVGGLIFEKGKRYAVIGSNGSGKTTMLKIIGGVIKPDKNAIFETDFAGGGNTICYMLPAPTSPALKAGIHACITKTDATISFGIWACGN